MNATSYVPAGASKENVQVRPSFALATQFGDEAERSPPAIASDGAAELCGTAYTFATMPSVEGETKVRRRRRALEDAGCAGTTKVAVTAVWVAADDGVADGCCDGEGFGVLDGFGTPTGATEGPPDDEHATVTSTDGITNIIAIQ